MESVAEIWMAIPGFENYEVSNIGRVRSLPHVTKCIQSGRAMRKTIRGRNLKLWNRNGYCMVKLGNPNQSFGVHQCVALAFIGPRPDGLTVNHKNGIKTDNRPENLEYVTNSENAKHAYRTGLKSSKGESNGKCKITREIAAQIAATPRTLNAIQVAAQFGCSVATVRQIRTGKTWKEVTCQTQ